MSTLARTQTQRIQINTDNPVMGAWIAIAFGLVIASFAAVTIRAALDAGSPAVMVAGGRLSIAALILTPWVLRNHKADLRSISRNNLLFTMGAGFWMCLHFTLMAFAMEHSRVGVVQVLVNTSPLMVAVLETMVLRTKLPGIVWFGLSMAIVGGMIIAIGSLFAVAPLLFAAPEMVYVNLSTGNPTLGAIFAIFSALAGALYLTIGRKVRADVSVIPYVWIMYGCGAISAFAIILITGTPVTGHPTMAYVWVIVLALGPQLISHSIFNYALAHIPATLVIISGQVVSFTAPLIAFFLFAEVPSLTEVFGGTIIVCGVIAAIVGQSRKQIRRRVASR